MALSLETLNLIKGAVKSGLASLSGITLGGFVVDPDHLSVATWAGLKRVLLLALITIAVAEARYLKQWLEKWSNS